LHTVFNRRRQLIKEFKLRNFMSLDNPNGIESSVSKNTKQRRTFLKRASATTLIASLPLKSSWAVGGGNGCSVSGNLSGNLSRDCSTSGITGLAPSQWLSANPSDNELNNQWLSIFTAVPFDSGNSDSDLVSTILATATLDAALLAAYLNAKNGHYGSLTLSAVDYGNGLYQQVSSGAVTQNEMLAAIESTYF
jgi:hypothetical protein